MRRFRTSTRWHRLFLTLSGMAMGVVAFSSCLKDDTGPSQISATAALNAVPGSEGLDIGLDNNQLNDRYWGEDFVYTDVLPYKNAYPGSRLVRVFDPGTPNAEPLTYETVNFQPGKFYTLYVVGDDELQIVVTEDDLTAPGEGNAKIRFMQLSPDAPALDIRESTGGDVRAEDLKFMDVGDFFTVEADEPYVFDVTEAGSNEVIHSIDLTPESNTIYTIWIKGLFDNSEDNDLAFGHDVITVSQ